MTAGNEVTGKAPADPQTRLAFRSWQFDRVSMAVRSLNAPQARKPSWIASAMASPAGNWPHDQPITATCALSKRRRKAKGDDGEPEHGPVPDPDCTCGIYATTDLDIINAYLSRQAPVLGSWSSAGGSSPRATATGPRTRGSR